MRPGLPARLPWGPIAEHASRRKGVDMWTTYGGVIVIPRIRAWTLTALDPPARLLPLRPLAHEEAFAIWREDFAPRRGCRNIWTVSGMELERLCVCCASSLCCAVSTAPGAQFSPARPVELGWTWTELDAVRRTLRIPCLAAWPESQWDRLEFGYDMAFRFGRDDLLAGLRRVQKADFDRLMNRACMAEYLCGVSVLPVSRRTPQLREELARRVDDLEARILAVSLGEYAERLATLGL